MGLWFYREEGGLSSLTTAGKYTPRKDAFCVLQCSQAGVWQGNGDALSGKQPQGRRSGQQQP